MKQSRAYLNSKFENFDKPPQEDFWDWIESFLHLTEDRDLLGLKLYNETTDYLAGDHIVRNKEILVAIGEASGVFDPAKWVLALVKNNFSATIPPTNTDDSSLYYSIGSLWLIPSTQRFFICVNNTLTSAIWKEITGSGGSSLNELEYTPPELVLPNTSMELSLPFIPSGNILVSANIEGVQLNSPNIIYDPIENKVIIQVPYSIEPGEIIRIII